MTANAATNTSTQIMEVLVLGLPQSGKTTFLTTISQQTQWDGDLSNRWFLGQLALDDNTMVQFLEPPSQPTFDFMWLRDLVDGMEVTGYLVLIDSAHPSTFGEAICVLQTIRAYHPETPCVLVATKQDHPQAWSPDDIRVGLSIEDAVPVLGCVSSNIQPVKEAVLQLLYRIFDA